jgi:uncharacterized protein YifN (PemK superfamily)
VVYVLCYLQGMSLRFVPKPGTILICNFFGHVEPEMVKTRRVVVISPLREFRADDATVIVVPLSEVPPRAILPWHHPIPNGRYLGLKACWAKGDLVTHVALVRLDRVFVRGEWTLPIMYTDDLLAIRAAVGKAIGLS